MIGEVSAGYELGKTLLEKAKAAYKNYSQQRARELMTKARGAYDNPYLSAYLAWKYPHLSLLHVAGHTYPVAVLPASSEQRSNPESILNRPLLRTRQKDSQLLPGSARYRALAHRLDLLTYDRPCFTMRRIETSPSPKIEAELGSYLRMLDTCDEFAWEVYMNSDRLTGDSIQDFESFDRKLPYRSRLHSQVADPALDGTNRSVAIAASALLAFYDDDQLMLLVKRRGLQSVAVHVGMVHVAPSFMFQPATGALDDEFSILHNFYREYLEELFNRPEPGESEGDWQYFYGDSRLRYFQELVEQKQIKILLTGLAINLLNLRPEVCLLVLVNTPDWYAYHRRHPDATERFQFNDEWMRIIHMGPDAETAVVRIPYQYNDSSLLTNSDVQPNQLVPPGAAALWMGKHLLDKIL